MPADSHHSVGVTYLLDERAWVVGGAGYSYGVTILPLPACYREDTPPECVQFHLLPPVGGILGVFAQSLPWVVFGLDSPRSL